MGAFDDTEPRSPTKSMLGRGIGEARRRIVLIMFLAFFLLLTIVAFRRQDTIKDVVNQSLHRTNTTHAVAKPETAADSKTDLMSDTKPDTTNTKTTTDAETSTKADTKTDSKSGTTSMWGKSKSKGPKLDNGDRTLAPSTLADIHNSTLGVCCTSHRQQAARS